MRSMRWQGARSSPTGWTFEKGLPGEKWTVRLAVSFNTGLKHDPSPKEPDHTPSFADQSVVLQWREERECLVSGEREESERRRAFFAASAPRPDSSKDEESEIDWAPLDIPPVPAEWGDCEDGEVSEVGSLLTLDEVVSNPEPDRFPLDHMPGLYATAAAIMDAPLPPQPNQRVEDFTSGHVADHWGIPKNSSAHVSYKDEHVSEILSSKFHFSRHCPRNTESAECGWWVSSTRRLTEAQAPCNTSR
uniref:Uncharacterized protein n=1 Tax=Knipowitschia caucasica TaxID=637954 RepID=A0AAV2LYD4_KNICA